MRTHVGPCLVILLLLASACATEHESTSPPDSTPPPVKDADAKPGDAPKEPRTFVNWTEEESAAFRNHTAPGWLVLRVRKAGTDEPVTDCNYYGVRFAFEEQRVAPHIHMEVDWFKRVNSPEGKYRWELASGWHQLRLEADDRRATWTPVFRIEEGKETSLDMEMLGLNRLRVTVLDVDGTPIPEGGVFMRTSNLTGGLPIEDGVGEIEVPDDEITLTVGKVFLKGYKLQTVRVKLEPGEVTEVTIRLTK